MGRGLAFGFFSYAIYDLTNWTTIDKWPTKLVVVDIIWGSFLNFIVSTISYSLFIGITA